MKNMSQMRRYFLVPVMVAIVTACSVVGCGRATGLSKELKSPVAGVAFNRVRSSGVFSSARYSPVSYRRLSGGGYILGESLDGIRVTSSWNCPQLTGEDEGYCEIGTYELDEVVQFSYKIENVSNISISFKGVLYGPVPNLGALTVIPITNTCSRATQGDISFVLDSGKSCIVEYGISSAILDERVTSFTAVFVNQAGAEVFGQQTTSFDAVPKSPVGIGQ